MPTVVSSRSREQMNGFVDHDHFEKGGMKSEGGAYVCGCG